MILALRERYKSCDLLAALRHALRYGAFDHTAVARILETTATPRTLDEYVADATRQKLEHWLGECRTEPRELREYDDLPCIKPRTPAQDGAPCPEQPPVRGDLHPPHNPCKPEASLSPSPATSCEDDSSNTSGSSGSST